MLQLLVLERVEPASYVHRYYVPSIEPTLFGEVGLRREWGRLGQRQGSTRLELHNDFAGAKGGTGAMAAEEGAAWIRGEIP